ncbi:MAG: hypothetical protein ACYDH2_08215, partial [Anaerolineaceae bacterium]
MKKLTFNQLFFIQLLILICTAIACSSASDSPVVISTLEDGSVTKTHEPSATPALGTSRLNPAAFGAEILTDHMIISILEVVRPADQLVRDGDMFNALPEEGEEYLFLKVHISCDRNPDQKCSFTIFDFKLV